MKMKSEARARYFEAGRAAGLSDRDIEAAIVESDRENAALDARQCPRCGARIDRKRDARQVGPHNVPGGVWHNYTCASCDYRSDRADVPVYS